MKALKWFLDGLVPWLPTVAVAVGVGLILFVVSRSFERSQRAKAGGTFRSQIVMLLLTFIGLVVVILNLPVDEEQENQLLSLVGIVLSAAIALSSTTVLGNAMAGLMLRAVKGSRPGDFIRVEGHFGRITEQGLVHTEIQTEDSDLTTLPNLFLVTHPVTVVRPTGTIVSATVSLGYDAPRDVVKPALLAAAGDADLEEPFVQVRDLGDFTVTYRVAGLLRNVKSLITARARLRERMMDALHGAGIEIVSPTFMNTRNVSSKEPIVPPPGEVDADADFAPETLIFAKADDAGLIVECEDEHDLLGDEIAALEKILKESKQEPRRQYLERQVAHMKRRREALEEEIDELKKKKKAEDS